MGTSTSTRSRVTISKAPRPYSESTPVSSTTSARGDSARRTWSGRNASKPGPLTGETIEADLGEIRSDERRRALCGDPLGGEFARGFLTRSFLGGVVRYEPTQALGVYSHALPSRMREAADVVDALYG